MRNFFILIGLAAVVGLAVGSRFPYRGAAPLLGGAVGAATAATTFTVLGAIVGEFGSRPLGWAIGGTGGLAAGGAVWLALIGAPSASYGLAKVGATAGVFAGAVAGSLVGATTLYREIKAGDYDRRTERMAFNVLFLGSVFLVGVFGLLMMSGVLR